MITISLLTVLSLSAFVGAAGAFIPGQTPAPNNTQYAISEGTASTDNMVGSVATTGGPNWQYSYDINQYGCESYLYSGNYGPTSAPVDCADYQLPGYSASPVCSVADTNCNNDRNVYALPPGTYVVFNANASLRIAMDQYGEFISTKAGTQSNTGTCGAASGSSTCGVAGLAYGSNEQQWQATESFASTGIPTSAYVQGWTFQMNDTEHNYASYAIEAYAIFSNEQTAEAGRGVYTWNALEFADNMQCPAALGATIGTGESVTPACESMMAGKLLTTGIQVLYDDQTLSVFRTTVTIVDLRFNQPAGENVSQITFTTVFNKDSKTVIVYKDLKLLLQQKFLTNIAGLAFSERYQLDLAHDENTPNTAYIHYFATSGYNQTTVYQHPLTGTNTFDAISAFDPKNQVNFFAAYWPNATQYTVYDPTGIVPGLDVPSGGTCSNYITCDGTLPTNTHVDAIPSPYSAPKTPWIIVQWMFEQVCPSFHLGCNAYPNLLGFLVTNSNNQGSTAEIRFVEVLGMTDLNSGTGATVNGNTVNNPYPSKDAQACTTSGGDPYYGCADPSTHSGPINQLGVEVQYLLEQIFNPESLNTVNGQTTASVAAGTTATNSSSTAGTPTAAEGLMACYYGVKPYNGMATYESSGPEYVWAYNCNHPFLWTAVGEASLAVDSAGAALLSPMQRNQFYGSSDSIAYPTPFALLDKNSTLIGQGSIPYALCEVGSFTGSLSKGINGPNACTGTTGTYTKTHSDSGTKTGLDTTTLTSSYLQNFYDNNTEIITQVQPIHGGCVSPSDESFETSTGWFNLSWFMPAKSPLTEAWATFNEAPAKPSCATSYDETGPDMGPVYGWFGTTTDSPNSIAINNQEGIITVGGPKANALTAYFNDWNFALDREGTNPTTYSYITGGSSTGTTPSNTGDTIDFFPISTWASTPVSSPSAGYSPTTWYKDTNNTVGFAVISIARDTIGSRGLSVYGWNGRDTYWASAWVSQWLGEYNPYYNNPFNWLPQGTVSIILEINYAQSTGAPSTWEPMNFNIVKALGTITELGFNAFINQMGAFDQSLVPVWTSTISSAQTMPDVEYYGGVLNTANNVNLVSCSSVSSSFDMSAIHSPGFSWFSTKLPTCTSASIEFN